jgi:predicted dinucleotide-binding enzyme
MNGATVISHGKPGLVRDAGFDPVIVGSLARGKEFEPDTPADNTGMNGRDLRTLFGHSG